MMIIIINVADVAECVYNTYYRFLFSFYLFLFLIYLCIYKNKIKKDWHRTKNTFNDILG